MPDQLEALRDEVHSLGTEIAGIRPLVLEVHGAMPRVSSALEKLAQVSEQLNNNIEDHKRLHYRITEGEQRTKELSGRIGNLERRFDSLHTEHVKCVTAKQVEAEVVRTSWWTRAKAKAADKVVELVTLAVVGFMFWMVVSHMKEYPKTAPLLNAPRATAGGK